MRNFPGLTVRSGGNIVDAPPEDTAVARGYPLSTNKGAWVEQRRISILSGKLRVRIGEPVRVIHVSETLRAGDELYVMGPKDIQGEYVDGALRTAAAPAKRDPLKPVMLDGRVEPAPAVDYNWVVTEYRFDSAGAHTIEWKLGALASNRLRIEVGP